MQTKAPMIRSSLTCLVASLAAAMLVAGCSTCRDKSSAQACCVAPETTAATPAVVAPPPATAAPAPALIPPPPANSAIRINVGATESYTDSSGNLWLPDQGFADGETIARPDLQIANTKDPALYRKERYSMTSFSRAVPNGHYTVKLHFAETFEDITGPGQRVFSFNVEGHAFKDFDVCAKASGPLRAQVETVNVDVTDGKLDIAFTSNIENPEINGIEIIPGN